MPPLVIAALGALGLVAAYRWLSAPDEEDQPAPESRPPQKLVRDPVTGIYRPERDGGGA